MDKPAYRAQLIPLNKAIGSLQGVEAATLSHPDGRTEVFYRSWNGSEYTAYPDLTALAHDYASMSRTKTDPMEAYLVIRNTIVATLLARKA